MVGKAGLKFADEVVGGGGGEDKVDRERLLRVKELEELGKGAGAEGLRGLVIPLVAVVCGGRHVAGVTVGEARGGGVGKLRSERRRGRPVRSGSSRGVSGVAGVSNTARGPAPRERGGRRAPGRANLRDSPALKPPREEGDGECEEGGAGPRTASEAGGASLEEHLGVW